jgi:glycosyltransferase involved in cell wall biosynthesis
MARDFRVRASLEPTPDVVVSSLPTLELCEEAVRYARRRQCPVLLDIRDLWPDVFLDVLPRWLRPAGGVALTGMRRSLRSSCRQATGLIAISPPYLQWGLSHAGRTRRPADAVFPHGYEEVDHSRGPDEAWAIWREFGLDPDERPFIACFFGAMGRQFDLATVIEAGRQLAERPGRRIVLVLCGDGESRSRYLALAGRLPNIVLPGWVDREKIQSLMTIASVGLAPYLNTPNFVGNLPNKPIEYFSRGLPVVTSLRGYLSDLLCQSDCGVLYEDATTLTRQLSGLANDPDRRQRLASNARRLFEERFDAREVYAAYSRHLLSVVSLAGSRRA